MSTATNRLRKCLRCGNRFRPVRRSGKFCTVKCKQAAYRHRVKVTDSVTLSGVHLSSEKDDWLTPQGVVESVLAVLGTIDLDPCSALAAR